MTPPIRKLDPDTASRIAAGEVIERPVSALKELIENALDAGARSIEVRVEGALDQFMSVADDGHGIAPAELELALERHATSKVERLDDLDRIMTLGFRGEALPSIAAVSRMRISSRAAGLDAAAFVAVEGGAVRERGAAARAPGTTVEVSDLFFNTPARKKFLTTPGGEMRAALRLLDGFGFARPDVAFRLVVDDRERFEWGATESRRDRARALWGARAEALLDASGERDGMSIVALLGLPEQARATREGQVLLVNGRVIQNPMLSHALRAAYGNLLPAGRHPIAVLWLTVPPARLDVNVHPTKREVRFADDGAVFSVVSAACARPLATVRPPFTVVRGGTEPPPWGDRVYDRSSQEALELVAPRGGRSESAAPAATAEAPRPILLGHAARGTPAAPGGPDGGELPEAELWQLHRTYLLAPVRGGLVIIDQHAAHERILYEQIRARLEGARGAAQQLLFPAVVELTRSQYDLLVEVAPWLHQLGWDVAPLGPPTAVVRGVPVELVHESAGGFLQDMLDGISDDANRAPHEDVVEHLARSYACRAAIKAGDALSPEERHMLVNNLFATRVPHGDPHGRVTYVRLDLEELHRRFGRS